MSSPSSFTYLDHNATTPVRPVAAAAIAETLAECGNPSSVHRAGRQARQRLEAARDAVAQAIGLPEGGTLVFTSGGTEANQLALSGTGRPRILRSAIEHDSVREAVSNAVEIPVEPGGTIDLAALEAALAADRRPALVSVMAANNETGVIQPVAEIVRLAQAAGALVHCDAIQAIGKIGFNMAALGADLVSLSAHKLGGPPGVGALALAPGLHLAALQRGGGQERGLRGGTENLPGIAGFAAAILAAIAELPKYQDLAVLRDTMERELLAIEPEAALFGATQPRLPNTSSVALPGLSSELQIMALDLAGVGVSAGSACSSGKVRPSHVLSAMGATPELARSAIRISLGRDTGPEDIERLVVAWSALARRRRAKKGAA
ncbi:MAG: cysteine desulfurase family protein [Aliidongia sp.]